MKKLFVILLCGICLCGCSNDSEDNTVNYLEAKEKIINEEAILVDVRTEEEYQEKHIEGAVLLPLDSIDETNILKIADSKEDVIIVYCRSGNRSHQALEKLNDLGYSHVYDLGAMSNWEE